MYGNKIRHKVVRVTVDGQAEILQLQEALDLAEEADMSLVLINEKAEPPVCKIVDLNKYIYENKQRAKNAKKKQREASVDLKEIRMGLNIGIGDIETKCNQIKKMLEKKCTVTLTVQLKGRERGKPNLAVELLNKFADMLNVELDTINTSGNRISARIKNQ